MDNNLNVVLRFILLSLWTETCCLILGLLQRGTGLLEGKFTARCSFSNRSGNHTGELVIYEDCTGAIIFAVGISQEDGGSNFIGPWGALNFTFGVGWVGWGLAKWWFQIFHTFLGRQRTKFVKVFFLIPS